jgi:hypothetical protein
MEGRGVGTQSPNPLGYLSPSAFPLVNVNINKTSKQRLDLVRIITVYTCFTVTKNFSVSKEKL